MQVRMRASVGCRSRDKLPPSWCTLKKKSYADGTQPRSQPTATRHTLRHGHDAKRHYSDIAHAITYPWC